MINIEKIDNPWYYYLNGQLIKRKKPCMSGDHVHIKSFCGCYRVYSVSVKSFVILRKCELIEISWDQFRCLKGHGTSEETIIKKELKSLISTIDISVSTQLIISVLLKNELQNLRKKFV